MDLLEKATVPAKTVTKRQLSDVKEEDMISSDTVDGDRHPDRPVKRAKAIPETIFLGEAESAETSVSHNRKTLIVRLRCRPIQSITLNERREDLRAAVHETSEGTIDMATRPDTLDLVSSHQVQSLLVTAASSSKSSKGHKRRDDRTPNLPPP